MKKILTLLAACCTLAAASAQTMNVRVGSVVYQVPAAQAGDMTYSDGTSLTIMNKAFALSDIDEIYIDDAAVTAASVSVSYDGDGATVKVSGDVMQWLSVSVSGADVTLSQGDDLATEVTYTLAGQSSDGSFTLDGKYKATVVFNGLDLQSQTGAPVTINNGKRIAVTVADGTANTLTDAAGGSQKACLFIKGHAEFTGSGTLTLVGNAKHAYRSNEYTQLKKKFTGTLQVSSAASDGLHVGQYYQQNAGNVSIANVQGDGIQVDYTTDDDGNRETDEENTGEIILKGGSVTIDIQSTAGKGLKADGNVEIMDGTLTIVQSGSLEATDDLSYPTSVKADGDINITGGTVKINNSGQGGKGLSADGSITIDESNATTVVDVTANGQGGTAELAAGTQPETQASYKVYVSVPSSGGYGPGGGSNAWSSISLYKSDGTMVTTLSSTVTRSSGYSTVTFYYYDFKTAGTGEKYYFKGGTVNRGGTTYNVRSAEFYAPSTGEDVYYSITNSYSTSGTNRIYNISDVTTSYGGTSDQSEDTGTSYNAAGVKADGNITIGGGTLTVRNSGAMSKSIKTKSTLFVRGGSTTLTPSGSMAVINSDASYSTGVKAETFTMTGGTLDITSSGAAGKAISVTTMTQGAGTITAKVTGAGQTINSNRYTAKGIKTDGNLSVLGGSLTINTTQAGAKGIKVNGAYVQGQDGSEGPNIYVSTQGSRYGTSSSSGGWGGGMGKTTGQGGAAKGIKAMGTVTVYSGELEIHTSADGGEGLESRTSIDIRGGKNYLACYDDCMSSNGTISFNGGVTVCYSNGNDAVDSNYGSSGAITIGNGTVLAYTSKGGAEEGLDCDNNSYIKITGTGIAISAGASQGGGGGGWGGSSSGNTISGAAQGYYFYTGSISYQANRYYTLADASGNNLVTYSFPASFSSSLALFTATGMKKGSSYNVKYSTTAPTDAATAFHGLYLGSSATGTNSVISSFTAQ